MWYGSTIAVASQDGIHVIEANEGGFCLLVRCVVCTCSLTSSRDAHGNLIVCLLVFLVTPRLAISWLTPRLATQHRLSFLRSACAPEAYTLHDMPAQILIISDSRLRYLDREWMLTWHFISRDEGGVCGVVRA